MPNPRLILVAFASAVLISACAGEPLPPAETPPPGPTAEEIEAMRQDSIRRAEEIRLAAEQAQRLEAEARETARRAEMMRQTLQEMVFFDYDESAIRSDTETMLRNKGEILRNHPGVQLRMEGHADERGTSEYNIALGNERAEAVIRFLADFGLDAARFSAVSYGEERPLAQGSSESSWERNRRVEFVITMGGDEVGR